MAAARAAVAAALDAGRQWLDPVQTKAVLDAYAIPNARAAVARTAEEAREAAKGLFAASRSCVIKILYFFFWCFYLINYFFLNYFLCLIFFFIFFYIFLFFLFVYMQT